LVVCEGLEVIALGKKNPEIGRKPWIVFVRRRNSLRTPLCVLGVLPVFSKIKACAAWNPAR
jgi:hypothetical protein